MRLLLLSDSHELHRELTMPLADLVLHAGDWTILSRSAATIRDFDRWLAELNPRYGCIGIPGNHEYHLEADPRKASLTPHLRILNGTEVTVAGLRIWGSPVTPSYGGAFGLSNPADRRRHWARIPTGINILITHGPPAGILDGGHGDAELREAVDRIRPKLHLFGHIHSAYGVVEQDPTTFVNGALLGPDGDLANQPLLLDI